MRNLIPLACAAILALPAGDAAAIVRCESADGKITYSNAECPANTRQVRKVEESPPVVVHEKGGTDTAASEPRPAQRIEKAKPRAANDPVQQDRQLTAQIAAQQRDCEARARQLQHLQTDLAGALPSNRSSAEMALRRAQAEYQTLCPKQR